MKATQICLFICIVGFLSGCSDSRPKDNTTTTTREEMKAIASALKLYVANVGDCPKGGSADIFKALVARGYLNPPRDRIGASGEFVDRWGTPYKIICTDQLEIVILCAGQAKDFGAPTSDYYWEQVPK